MPTLGPSGSAVTRVLLAFMASGRPLEEMIGGIEGWKAETSRSTHD